MTSSYYIAPITLAEDLVVGATVSGTINGTEVVGTVRLSDTTYVELAPKTVPKASGGLLPIVGISSKNDGYVIMLTKHPEIDLTIHLTQTAPTQKVTIPEEYLELTETEEAIAEAKSAANKAQAAANSAQTTANSAQTTANSAQTTANTTAERYQAAQATIGKTSSPYRKSYILLDVGTGDGVVAQSIPTKIVLHSDQGVAPDFHTNIQILLPVVGRYIGYNNGEQYVSQLNLIGETVYAGGTSSLNTVEITGLASLVIASSTLGSTKKFRITVDDTGEIKATEVTV